MDKPDELAEVIAPHLLAMSDNYSDVPVEHIWTRPRYQHLADRIEAAAAAVRAYANRKEVVERVAAAIAKQDDGCNWPEMSGSAREWERWVARAALSAAGGGDE